MDAGLARQVAVRKRKEVHEMNGHKFIPQQFYQIMLCAYCNEFLLNATGYQCEDCRYLCHKKCYEKVVTKCISKSNSGTVRGHSISILNQRLIFHHRRATKRRSSTEYLIASRHSRISAQIGVVIVATCFRLGVKTRRNAASAALPAIQHARTSCLISAV